MDKGTAIALHRKMWRYLGRTGGKSKKDALFETIELRSMKVPENYCFLCEYMKELGHGTVNCDKCLLQWKTIFGKPIAGCCSDQLSAFIVWKECDDIGMRKAAAKIISELPVVREQEVSIDLELELKQDTKRWQLYAKTPEGVRFLVLEIREEGLKRYSYIHRSTGLNLDHKGRIKLIRQTPSFI